MSLPKGKTKVHTMKKRRLNFLEKPLQRVMWDEGGDFMAEMRWYKVWMVVPGTDGDAENGPCEPMWWNDMEKAPDEETAICQANDKARSSGKNRIIMNQGWKHRLTGIWDRNVRSVPGRSSYR